jgi:membrane associated rhomboid family serine protease
VATHFDTEDWNAVFSAAELVHARDVVLVLEARAVPNRIERHGPRWVVLVPARRFDDARAEVTAWHSENAEPAGGERRLRVLGSGWPGVAVWNIVLVVVAILATRQTLGHDWYTAGRAEAAAIMTGELWRALTALTLHADTVHLLGNLVFGSFFGFYVGKYLGEGFGWSLILIGGVLGNTINAFVQSPLHLSVGASTAVFAALGILTTWRWRRGFEPNTSWRVRFAPLYAGIALLAFTGTAGESTDLGAHLFGFVSGLLLGLLAARVAERLGPRAQMAFAASSALCCLVAWRAALA